MNVLIGMVISSLLVGFVYTVYTNLSQISAQYTSTQLEVNGYKIAKADVKRNMQTASVVQPTPHGFVISNEAGVVIDYYLDGKQLIKKTNKYKSVLFENVNKIKVFYVINESGDTENTISSISITFLIENQEISVYLYSSFDSQKKLNSTLLNEY